MTLPPTFFNAKVYTAYALNTIEFGSLDAFCIEGVGIPTSYPVLYELLEVPVDLGFQAAAYLAELYWSGNTNSYTRADFAVAIWSLTVTDFAYHGAIGDPGYQFEFVRDLWTGQAAPAYVYLAHNPVGDYENLGYQDFLVRLPVSEPATMLLLGATFVAFAAIGRRKYFK